MRKVGYPLRSVSYSLRSSSYSMRKVGYPLIGQLLIEVEQLLYEDGPLLCGRPDL